MDNLASEGHALREAINGEEFTAIRELMTRHPELHRFPMGYNNNGPLTWVAECRVPWRPPSPIRFEMARWMIEHGSDIHQGGDGPLMRAALNAARIPMMELLVEHGADVNAAWDGWFPILFAPCEAVDPEPLHWLLQNGARPDTPHGHALDYLAGTYVRSPRLASCIELLLAAGATSRHDTPGVFEILRGRLDLLRTQLDVSPDLAHRQFAGLDIGATAARRLTLDGCTLLHVAAEFGNLEAAQLLLSRGAGVDAPSVSGHTALFHCATQNGDGGLAMIQLLLRHGASRTLTARVPGHYERPEEWLTINPLGYALLFPGGESATTAALRGGVS